MFLSLPWNQIFAFNFIAHIPHYVLVYDVRQKFMSMNFHLLNKNEHATIAEPQNYLTPLPNIKMSCHHRRTSKFLAIIANIKFSCLININASFSAYLTDEQKLWFVNFFKQMCRVGLSEKSRPNNDKDLEKDQSSKDEV